MLRAYKQSLLETDARIIAEDANHIVFSVRVPKRVIANHADLFGAVSKINTAECVGLARHRWTAMRLITHPVTLSVHWTVMLFCLLMR